MRESRFQTIKKKNPRYEKRGRGTRMRKAWVKEYQWRSLNDFNTHPKWFGDKTPFDTEWHLDAWSRFKSPEGILESLKSELRSNFRSRFIQGRNWRARNVVTNECVYFPDIEHYYK